MIPVDLIIPDAGPLISLAHAGRLDLVDVFNRPVAVIDCDFGGHQKAAKIAEIRHKSDVIWRHVECIGAHWLRAAR
jgi:hypothetical protein